MFSANSSRVLITDNGNTKFDTDNKIVQINSSVEMPEMRIYYPYCNLRTVALSFGGSFITMPWNATSSGFGGFSSATLNITSIANPIVLPFMKVTGGLLDTNGGYIFSPGSTVLDTYFSHNGFAGAMVAHTRVKRFTSGAYKFLIVEPILEMRLNASGDFIRNYNYKGIYNSAGTEISGIPVNDAYGISQTLYDFLTSPKFILLKIDVSVKYKIFMGEA